MIIPPYRTHAVPRALVLLCAVFLSPTFLMADEQNPIAIRWWGMNAITIETHWNFEIAINPLAETKNADLCVLTSSGYGMSTGPISKNAINYKSAGMQPFATQVLDRLPNQSSVTWSLLNAASNPSANAVRVLTIAKNEDPTAPDRAVHFEVDGVRILVCEGLGLGSLSQEQLNKLVGLDVLIVNPVEKKENDKKAIEMIAWIERLKPRFFIPMATQQSKTDTSTRSSFDYLAQAFGDKVEALRIEGNTHAVRAAKKSAEQKTQLVLMAPTPWEMPKELAELFLRKETACRASQTVFAKLSVEQLNFRPSNGTHTARWNTEHMMGRELGFFSQIYAKQDPNIVAMDLNPKQMPPDYVASHPDWTGDEEARQTERVSRFSRRFAYLLKDLPMDKKAPGSFWTPKSLLLQMEAHYLEHTANVVKKFELPDWPKGPQTLSLNVWPDLAPDETSRDTGSPLPAKAGETKPITRVSGIRRPTLDVYPAKNPSGAAVLILPGGGFTYVVPDLEGSEAAPWLNELGITVFVLRYRTKESAAPGEPLWQRPLQDTQRAMRLIRSEAPRWQLQSDQIGLLAFSAGGQVGAIAHSKADQSTYPGIDTIDQLSCKPDFSMLIYPWQVLDPKTDELLAPIQITDQSSPAFMVHTHDDASSAVGAAKLYIAFKQHKVPAELHVYQNGGHGYGLRDRPDSVISTWPARATEWLKIRRIANSKQE